MARLRNRKNPKYVRAFVALLLGGALIWLVVTSTTDRPRPAEVCNQQGTLCGNLLRPWEPLQKLFADITPDRIETLLRESKTGLLDPLRQNLLMVPRVAQEYFVVSVFLLGLILGSLGIVLLIRAAFLTTYNFRNRETKYQSTRERALRRWFAQERPRLRSIVIPLLLGILSIFGATQMRRSNPPWNTYLFVAFFAIGVVVTLWGAVRLARAFIMWLRMPSDRKVKAWFEESKDLLKKEALRSLGLYESELAARKPLLIMSEILESERDFDIPENDIVLGLARDGTLYCGAYIATIIFFTHRHMAIYRAEYSFIRGEAMDEETYESHYEDIVILATTQKSYTKLNTGDKIKWAEQFSLSFPSGEKVPVWVANDGIFLIRGGNRLPATDAEQAISVIRSQMRDIKRGADQQR